MSLASFMQKLMTPEQAGGVPVNAMPGDGGPVGADAYRQLLAREMERYHGDRDQAVRSANIAGGFGNSTAERFMHEMAAAQAPAPMTTGAIPTPRPPAEPGIGSGIPTPTTPPALPPDLAVSPMRPDNITQMRDAERPRAMSPDLAVSPPRPDNAAAAGPGPQRLQPLPTQELLQPLATAMTAPRLQPEPVGPNLQVKNGYPRVKGKQRDKPLLSKGVERRPVQAPVM